MPSSWTHAMSAVAVGASILPSAPPRVWTILAIVAVIPDLDAIGRPFGLGDLAFLGGHRALSHSLAAAAALGLLAAVYLRRRSGASSFGRLWLALFFAAASHGVLDAFTEYGRGVAFLAPWNGTRMRAWPLLSGFWTDLTLFAGAWLVARVIIQRRGWPLPRALAWSSRTTSR